METICIKCQILFSGKNKKNIINLSSAEFVLSVLKAKLFQVGHGKLGKRENDLFIYSIYIITHQCTVTYF